MERKDLPLIGPPGAGSTRTAESAAPSGVETPAKPLMIKGDPSRVEARPGKQSEPTSRFSVPPESEADDAVLAQLGKIEQIVRDAKKARAERDEARARIGRIEHELSELQEENEKLKESAGRIAELQRQLDGATRAQAVAAAEAASLKTKVAEGEAFLKAALGAAASSEVQLKRQENALVNAKEARDEAQYKIDAAMAVLQGRPAPPKPDKKK